MTRKIQKIEDGLSSTNQAVTRTIIGKMDDFKVRLSIKSDSYQSQCHAVVSVWSTDQLSWNEVHRILPSQMETETGIAYLPQHKISPRLFDRDVDHLTYMLEQILF